MARRRTTRWRRRELVGFSCEEVVREERVDWKSEERIVGVMRRRKNRLEEKENR